MRLIANRTASNSIANKHSVFLMKASGFAPPASFAAGSGPRGGALADLDGDGRPDIVTANYGANTMTVLLNRSTAACSAP